MNGRETLSLFRNFEEKKVGVAGLQPTLYLHDYSKLSN